jgi:hypothetical protein
VADDRRTQLADEHEEPPEAEAVDHVVDRLAAHGITTDADQVRELAGVHGLGGAVRLLAWADAGVSVDEVAERRAAGEGWGQIAKDLGVHPGIGSIMGNGGGHGRDDAPGRQNAPGQQDRGTDD